MQQAARTVRTNAEHDNQGKSWSSGPTQRIVWKNTVGMFGQHVHWRAVASEHAHYYIPGVTETGESPAAEATAAWTKVEPFGRRRGTFRAVTIRVICAVPAETSPTRPLDSGGGGWKQFGGDQRYRWSLKQWGRGVRWWDYQENID